MPGTLLEVELLKHIARRYGAKHVRKSKVFKTDGLGTNLNFTGRKRARRGGTKDICKSKVFKTDGLGPLIELQMSEKCTPLRRKAHKYRKLKVSEHFLKSEKGMINVT
jgi:hypothetical protein